MTRVVAKISSCRVNTTSRRGIKQLGILFGSVFLLFSNESSREPLALLVAGENSQPPALNDNPAWLYARLSAPQENQCEMFNFLASVGAYNSYLCLTW